LTFDGTTLTVTGISKATSYFSANDQGYIRGDSAGYLVLQGGSTATNFNNSSNGSTLMTILNGGNIGIGTTSPNSRLSVNGGDIEFNRGTGAIGNYYFTINKGSGNDGGIILRRENVNDWQIDNGSSAGNLFFYSYGTTSTVLTILRSSGNVGIGTTSPAQLLHVAGDINVSSGQGFRINNTATSGQYLRGDGTRFISATLGAGDLSGTIPSAVLGNSTVYIGTTGIQLNRSASPLSLSSVSIDGSAGSATTTTGTSGQLLYKDDRIIEPNSISSGYLQFGFTSFNNNNTSPWADYLHLRSYTDSSGGSDNLVVFSRSSIAMRIYQQTWNSGTAYSSYADVWTSVNDGASSGLDADLLDGQHGSYYAAASSLSSYLPLSGGTMTAGILFNGSATSGPTNNTPTALSYGRLQGYGDFFINADTDLSGTEYVYITAGKVQGSTDGLRIGQTVGTFTWMTNTIWHAGNDGASSGLDADLLDGNHASAFLGVSAKAADSELLDGVDSARFIYGESGRRRGVNLITDWNQNSLPDVAFLSSENSTTNAPSTDYTYGLQYAFHRDGAAYRTQLVTSLYSNPVDIWVRNSRDSDVWTTWYKLVHSGNVSSYATTGVTAGSGLTGGGSVGSLTVNVGAGDGISVAADTVAVDSTVLRTTGGQNISGAKVFYSPTSTVFTAQSSNLGLTVFQETAGSDAFMTFHVGGDYAGYFGLGGSENDFMVGGWSFGSTRYRVWHSGNDGSGSGLDADLLDGNHASVFHINGSGNAMTCSEAYIHNWARTYGEEGLYSQDYGQHFYPDSGAFYWEIDGPLRVRDGYEGTIKGYVGYHDSNGFGLLDDGGSWWLNTPNDDRYLVLGGSQALNAYNSVTGRRLMLGGGDADAQGNYYIGTNLNDVGGNYNKLDLAWHTGIRMGAQGTYGGIRFFNTEDLGTLRFQIEGSNGYIYKYVWMYTPTEGFYSDTNNAHWNPNASSSYGAWRLIGTRGGYTGILFSDVGNTLHLMGESSNIGFYYEASGRWSLYYNYTNNSWGFRSSTTSSSYAIYATGAIYSTDNIVAYSDARAKENVRTILNALQLVESMRGVYYNKINTPEKPEVGVIAQEINEVLPHVVTYDKENDQYGVSYGNIAAVLIEAVKELSQEVKRLKAKLGEE
jgi:hypothetical protein